MDGNFGDALGSPRRRVAPFGVSRASPGGGEQHPSPSSPTGCHGAGQAPLAEFQTPARALYLAAALLLLTAVAHRAWHRGFLSDFWEHAASIRALAEHPLQPRHPLLDIAAPHEFLSPYSMLLGLIARVSGMSAVGVLELASIGNLILLLSSLHFFVRRVRGNSWAPVTALVFILFLWGPQPWLWSGFFHLGVLSMVAPYPSTLAAALVFLVLGLELGDGPRSSRRVAGLALILAVILLIHPITAVVLVCGLGACWLQGTRSRPATVVADAVRLGAALGGGVLLAMLWPYFHLGELLFGEAGAAIRVVNSGFYQDVLSHTWPAWLGIPALVVRFTRDRRDALVWWELALVAVYIAGALSGARSVGRIISFIVMIPQIALGVLIAEWLARWMTPTRAWTLALSCAGVLLFWVAPRSWRMDRPSYPTAFVARHVGPNDVVLSDRGSSFRVPAFAGKVVVSRPPVAWIPDDQERRRDVARFFDADTAQSERHAILDRYAVRFLLIPKGSLTPAGVTALGTPVEETQEFTLYRVRQPSRRG